MWTDAVAPVAEGVITAVMMGLLICVVLGPIILLMLTALGILWAPFAAMRWSQDVRRHGLDSRFYGSIAAIYSLHLFIPYVLANRRMNDWHQTFELSAKARWTPYVLWAWGTIAPSIVISWAYLWEHIVKDTFKPGFSLAGVVVVGIILLIPIPVNIITWIISIRRTRRRDVPPFPIFDRAESSPYLPADYAKPLFSLGCLMVVPFFFIGWIIALPLFIIIVVWRSWVGRVRGRGMSLALRGELAENVMLPNSLTTPFAYSFMWLVWHLWSYGGAALVYFGFATP